MYLYFDIETIGTEDEAVIAAIADGITPPGNMSKASTIEEWRLDKKPALVEEAVLKTSFDGTYGRIVCIGYAVNDEDPQSFIGTERDILTGFFAAAAAAAHKQHQNVGITTDVIFVGHNISSFDLRFLWQRAVINRVPMTGPLLKACKAKPWDNCIADTLLMWSPERERRISLDKLCKALNVPTSKGDMDGSKVWAEYKAGNIEKIAAYCRGDVSATRECWKRMTWVQS